MAALQTSRTVEVAASKAGISTRSAWRYLGKPEVRRAIADAQGQMLAAVTSRAVNGMTDALHTLEVLHMDAETPAAVRATAARAILEYGPRLTELVTLAERIEALEERIA